MLLDTSAVVATIANEPSAVRYQTAMLGAASLVMSAVTVLESRIVLYSRHGKAAFEAFDDMLKEAEIEIAPFDAQLAELAFEAFRRYGKGQRHPAKLNIIDCAAYALARMRDEPLLFKGGDFDKTDVRQAI